MMTRASENNPTYLSIRLASLEDVRLLWEWANDPTVRANAFNPEPIPWESHVRWYEKRLTSPDTRFWLLEIAGEPVGQIRFDRDADGRSAEISFSVVRNHRGKGYGAELVCRTCARACVELRVQEIVALVLSDNVASYQTFLRAGFKTRGLSTVRGQSCYRFIWQPGEGIRTVE